MALLPSERLAFAVDDDAAVALLGKIERGGKADRSRADDDDRVVRRLSAILVRRAPVGGTSFSGRRSSQGVQIIRALHESRPAPAETEGGCVSIRPQHWSWR